MCYTLLELCITYHGLPIGTLPGQATSLSELGVAIRVCVDQHVFLEGSTLRDGSMMEISVGFHMMVHHIGTISRVSN